MPARGEQPVEELDTSMGQGMTHLGSTCIRYVVVGPDSPLLREDGVGIHEYGTVVVSAELPTQPGDFQGAPPTQADAVRAFVHREFEALGMEPRSRPLSVGRKELRHRLLMGTHDRR